MKTMILGGRSVIVEDGGYEVHLGTGEVPVLSVPGDLLTVYQPVIGYQAVMLWIHLKYHAMCQQVFLPDTLYESGFSQEDIEAAFDRLTVFGLVSETEEGAMVVHEPLVRPLFDRFFKHASNDGGDKGEESASPSHVKAKAASAGASGQPYKSSSGQSYVDDRDEAQSSSLRVVETSKDDNGSKTDASSVTASPLTKRGKAGGVLTLVDTDRAMPGPEDPDMQAVIQIYQKRIGMIGPTQYEKIRFWVEEQGMDGAVVAIAIEETVRSADVPRISYLEGILRNWYNDGIRTFTELKEHKKVSKVLSGGKDGGRRVHKEGTANASAYESISPEKVAKWKELYPDEYDG